MLPQAASNEIFSLKMRYDTSKLCVKYLIPGDTGWHFMIDDRYKGTGPENRKFDLVTVAQ